MINSKTECETNNFYLSALEYVNGVGLLDQKRSADPLDLNPHLSLLPLLASSSSFMNGSIVPRFVMRSKGRTSSLDRPDFKQLVCELLFNHSSTLQFAQSYNFCSYRFTEELRALLVNLAQKFPHAHKSLRQVGSYQLDSAFLADLVKCRYCEYLTELRLAATAQLDDAGMKHLESFSNLRALCLSSASNVTNDAIVSALNHLAPRLEHLEIMNIKKFTASAFLRLNQMPNLRTLSLDNQKYLFLETKQPGTEKPVNPFENFSQQLPNLTSLDVSVCGITDDALGCMCPVNAASHLRNLRVYQNRDSVTDEGFEKFFASSHSFVITSLNISYNALISDRTMFVVASALCLTLTDLNIRCSDNVKDDGIASLCNNLLVLEKLNMSACNKLTFASIRHLTSQHHSSIRKTLTFLDIRGCFFIFCPEDNPAFFPAITEKTEREVKGDEEFVNEFKAIASLPKLDTLGMAALGLNISKLKVLFDFNAKVLRVLSLADSSMFTNDCLDVLGEILLKKHLVVTEKIDLSGCWKLSKERVEEFKNRLKNFGMSDISVPSDFDDRNRNY